MTDRLKWWEEIPLGLALLAQSYVIGLWYFASVSGADWWVDLLVAVGAGLALDLIVVTTVMGRRQGRSSGWSWATSFGAFLCSALIAMDRYGWEWRSLLHVAFPLVVFLYSQHLATPRKIALAVPATVTSVETQLEPMQQANTRQRLPGYVYVLRGEGQGFKIGCAQDVDARLRSIAGFVPFSVEVVHTIATADMYATETRIHRYFESAGKRGNGEWFDLSSIDLSAIQAVAEQDIDVVFDRALRLLSDAGGMRDREFDAAFWLQQADTKQPLELKQKRSAKPIIAKRYSCPHCHRSLSSKQAVGAAVKNGYCLGCKEERKAA